MMADQHFPGSLPLSQSLTRRSGGGSYGFLISLDQYYGVLLADLGQLRIAVIFPQTPAVTPIPLMSRPIIFSNMVSITDIRVLLSHWLMAQLSNSQESDSGLLSGEGRNNSGCLLFRSFPPTLQVIYPFF